MDLVFGNEILQDKNRYDMNQNFEDTERGIKVAVYAGKQSTIRPGTCTLLEVCV